MVYTISKGGAPAVSAAAWKPYLISFLASLPFLVHGAGEAVRATANPGPLIDQAEVPWSTVTNIISSLVTAPLCALLINRYGRKVGMYTVALLQGVACIPPLVAGATGVADTASTVVWAGVAGAYAGALFLAVPVYVREVSTNGARGTTLALMMPMTCAGNALTLILSTEHMLYLMIAIVAIELLVIFFIPESPAYYVIVNKLQDAKISTGKLVSLKCEEAFVCNQTRLLQQESERARANGDADGNLTIFAILKNRIYRDELKIGFTLSTTTILSGCIIFLDQNKVLAQLQTDADPGEMLVPISLLIGGAACFLLIGFSDRKYLLSVAYSIMVLSMGTLAVYTQSELTVTSLRWVPVAALPVLVVSYGAIWAMPTILLVEILNLEVRATGMAAVWAYAQVIRLAHELAQSQLEQYVGVYTLLYAFAGVDMFGAVYAACALPAVRARTVRQVERQLRRVPIV